jgi:hypothetical protein
MPSSIGTITVLNIVLNAGTEVLNKLDTIIKIIDIVPSISNITFGGISIPDL